MFNKKIKNHIEMLERRLTHAEEYESDRYWKLRKEVAELAYKYNTLLNYLSLEYKIEPSRAVIIRKEEES